MCVHVCYLYIYDGLCCCFLVPRSLRFALADTEAPLNVARDGIQTVIRAIETRVCAFLDGSGSGSVAGTGTVSGTGSGTGTGTGTGTGSGSGSGSGEVTKRLSDAAMAKLTPVRATHFLLLLQKPESLVKFLHINLCFYAISSHTH
jgi:hypothetical protein